ncbi:MAG: hypothetical protein EOM67_01185 [Spirochaetia bacterium]|nr:hypothetical protein [Spirochaetia bacterium]
MATYTFGKLEIDPVTNPSILNTGTWDSDAVARFCKKLPESFYKEILELGNSNPAFEETICHSPSIATHNGVIYGLLEFVDGQTAFVMIGSPKSELMEGQICNAKGPEGKAVVVYPSTDVNIHAYTRYIHTRKGPRALGAVPRIGIGVRHSATIWPGIMNAMYKGDFSANCIQNSVRELHLLETLTSGTPSRTNHLFSFGPVKEGHAGSTFEGLVTQGILQAIKFPHLIRYGADADHLQVKRGSEGIERTKKFIDAAKYYSFYTLDVSDILDYSAMFQFSAKQSIDYLETCIPNAALRSDVVWYHKKKKSLGKQFISLDEAQIGRLVGKYWAALDAIEKLYGYLDNIKKGEPYDMELSIDENPPHVKTFDTITTYEELLFLVDEIERRGLPITHLAPNFGVEKGVDYRGADGKKMLEQRVSILHKIASEKNMMLDCHSGDDLSRETRGIFKRATQGNIHFKISPSLQSLYGEVIQKVNPEFFRFWWEDTYRHTQQLAKDGVPFAIYSLNQLKWSGDKTPSATHLFFQEFCYATLGDRDDAGQFKNRDKFYNLPVDQQQELDGRIEERILEVASDLFNISL